MCDFVVTLARSFFVLNKDSSGYYVVLHNPCDTPVKFGVLSENPDIMRLL